MNHNENVIVEAPLYIYWKIRQLKLLTFCFFWLCFRFNLLSFPFYFHVMHPMENEDLIDKYKKSIQCGFNVVLYWRKLLFVIIEWNNFEKAFYLSFFQNQEKQKTQTPFLQNSIKVFYKWMHFTMHNYWHFRSTHVF